MNAGERDSTANGRTVTNGAGTVLVVAVDNERRSRYESELQRARISARMVSDAEEAESVIEDTAPNVLVLDRGLRQLALFRLFSLVRSDATDPPTQVVFVGRGGETGPDDHYLPGEPSVREVVERVSELLERARPTTGASALEAPVADPMSRPHAGTAPVEAASAPAIGAAPARSRPRLDTILIGIGLALLILGALLMFILSDSFARALIPGSSAPGPKPGALADGIPAVVDVLPYRFAACASASPPPRVLPVSGASCTQPT